MFMVWSEYAKEILINEKNIETFLYFLMNLLFKIPSSLLGEG